MKSVTFRPKHETLAQKWRKPASAFVATIGMLAALLTVPIGLGYGWHELMELGGFVLLCMAALGRIWSLAYIAGRKNRELCQSGPYSLTRNPLYFFSFIGVVGFTLAVQNVLLGGLAAPAFLIYYAFVIRGEETRLQQLHGDNFTEYCLRVPRFWPRFAKPSGVPTVELNLIPFTRGMREASCFLGAIVLAELIEWAHSQALWTTLLLPL